MAWTELGGWDDEPKVPRFRMPPGATDCHVHLIGPKSRFAFVGAHAARAYDAPKEVLREIHGRLGVERCVVVHGVAHGRNVAVTLDALFTAGGRYRATMPHDPDVTDRRLQELDACGFRAVRFNFMARLGGPPARDVFLRAAERIAPLGWHILVHMDADEIDRYENMLRESKAPLVFDHMLRLDPSRGTAQAPFRKLVAFLRDGRDWVKLSAFEKFAKEKYPFRDMCGIAAALVDAAPDRCIWGTDWPHPDVLPGPTNDADLADLVPSYAPTPALQRKLLVENPARLYGF